MKSGRQGAWCAVFATGEEVSKRVFFAGTMIDRRTDFTCKTQYFDKLAKQHQRLESVAKLKKPPRRTGDFSKRPEEDIRDDCENINYATLCL